ncbi:uncharacterized protein LOC117791148 [Drosophila innubila]|uniref:uncharacterized protein LOC117791148 n=1 Tax=Drosophila innubila TaxID=198719 RepID=UPI00148E0CE4|nr:uncharacterized protein LOC117791148 [Drosophila innubila]
MDLMLKLSEQVQEQLSNMQQQEEGGGDVPFRSVYTLNGNPILPPLMTPERRLEMQQLRDAAVAIEKQLDNELNNKYNHGNRKRWLNSDCCQFVDASTSTDPQLPQQPLIIAGRLKQQLQFSETLIYDNNRNAIIKFVRPDQIKLMQLLLEECPEMRAQLAVIIEACPKFATLTINSREEQPKPKAAETETETEIESELELESKPEPATPNEYLEKETETPTKEATTAKDRALKDLIGVARKLKENIIQTERELQRSFTSPYLPSKAEKDIVSSYCCANRSERLHPHLWKRYHSYPFGSNCKPSDCAAPTSPNADTSISMEVSIPMAAPPPTPMATPSSKIQVKQRMAPEDQQAPVETQLKSKISSESQQKLVGSKSSKKTPRASSSVSYAAHATSHAKVEGGNNDGNTRMSSTQRRLNYDPRATLKRATTLKKAATVNTVNTVNSTPATVHESSMKRKMIEELEQTQRHRFHQFVSQQAEEQQRMREEFQSQQQLLMDQMLSDISIYTFDKFEAPDQPESDSSSITSLPQSRLDLDSNEDHKSGM